MAGSLRVSYVHHAAHYISHRARLALRLRVLQTCHVYKSRITNGGQRRRTKDPGLGNPSITIMPVRSNRQASLASSTYTETPLLGRQLDVRYKGTLVIKLFCAAGSRPGIRDQISCSCMCTGEHWRSSP